MLLTRAGLEDKHHCRSAVISICTSLTHTDFPFPQIRRPSPHSLLAPSILGTFALLLPILIMELAL